MFASLAHIQKWDIFADFLTLCWEEWRDWIFNEFNLQMLSLLKLCTNARSSTLFVKLVKLNDEREALGFCLPPNLIYRKFLIRLGRMWRSFCWNDSGLFSLIKNYRHLSFSVVMLTFWVMMGCGTGRENFSAV